MSRDPTPVSFEVAGGMRIAADVAGPEDGARVVLLHGGGQTRHSWKNGLKALAARGFRAWSLDARGHGDSGWARDGEYGLDALVSDLAGVCAQIDGTPALVGASMGGVTALAALGEGHVTARALVLVDVTPKVKPEGSQRIGDFMRANPEGFATLEEVADAVSAYNPHRPRPDDISGLRRNLREVDGRLFWHWDPAFLGERNFGRGMETGRLSAAAQAVKVPTLLVRGGSSELVGTEEVEHFRALIPRADYADIAGAGHMVAGDRNDAFNAAIVDFLGRIDG